MPAIDRKTIARAVFPHYARNEFAAVGFAHQQILLKVTPASSLHLALDLHPWPERADFKRAHQRELHESLHISPASGNRRSCLGGKRLFGLCETRPAHLLIPWLAPVSFEGLIDD